MLALAQRISVPLVSSCIVKATTSKLLSPQSFLHITKASSFSYITTHKRYSSSLNRMATVNIGEILSASIDVAENAGELIRQIHKSGDLQIQIKGYTQNGVEDPLTQADIKAQLMIINGLLSHWPGLSILGEEDRTDPQPVDTKPRLDRFDLSKVPDSLQKVPLEDVVVFVDPLDATREFTKGKVECVMTLIGITVKGVPTAGVMYQPFVGNGATFYGLVGSGAWGFNKLEKPNEGLVVATTASHINPTIEEAIAKLNPSQIMRVGGAGYKALLVLEERAQAYVFPSEGCKLWDTCAPQAILNARGGVMTDSTGANIVYKLDGDHHVRKGVIACLDPKLHEKVISLINNKSSL